MWVSDFYIWPSFQLIYVGVYRLTHRLLLSVQENDYKKMIHNAGVSFGYDAE